MKISLKLLEWASHKLEAIRRDERRINGHEQRTITDKTNVFYIKTKK